MSQELLTEIRLHLIELVKQGAVHNAILAEHERRSLALQAQTELLRAELTPVKEHVGMVNTAAKWLGAISVGAIVQWVARHLL